jgi:hypothetical protein
VIDDLVLGNSNGRLGQLDGSPALVEAQDFAFQLDRSIPGADFDLRAVQGRVPA